MASARQQGTQALKVFFDLDGVLADFDAGAEAAIGTSNTYKWEWLNGSDAFWDKLNAVHQFFYNLPMMPDGAELWAEARHLVPTILTAIPKKDDMSVAAQKRWWVAERLGVDVPVITCLTSEKPNYCNPGDILVDDRSVNKALWELRGGIFIQHVNAADTLRQLRELEVI